MLKTRAGAIRTRSHTARQPADAVALRVGDASRQYGLGESSIWALIATGELPSFKAGGRRLIWRKDIEAFMRRAANAQADA